jgi:cold shock CspA family protein
MNITQHHGFVFSAAPEKGYCFVQCGTTHSRFFCHIREIHGGIIPAVGEKVIFSIIPSDRQPGRMQATQVRIVEAAG